MGILLRAAVSRSKGLLVAARTKTCELLLATPSTCIRNSVFTLLEASCSPSPFHDPSKESISSKNITEGALSAATSNNFFISFSPSPSHQLIIVDAEILMNVQSHSVATAFARKVLPFPGGP